VATAVKWDGLLMLVVLGCSFLFAAWRRRREGRDLGVRLILVSYAAAFLAFLALDPHIVTEPAETLQGHSSHVVRYEAEYGSHNQDPRRDYGRGITFHSLSTLPVACGWLGLGAALFGLAVALRRKTAAAWTCLLFLSSCMSSRSGRSACSGCATASP
jgi:hypothetical protein